MLTIVRFLWASFAIWTAYALHPSEAGVVDWHKALLGVPLTRPDFHRTTGAHGATRSVVLTATSNNVIGAVHPENGTVAWRYLFEDRDPVVGYKAYNDRLATLSGPGGATFRILDVNSGHLLHELHLHSADSGRLFEPVNLGVAIAFDDSDKSKDTFVLTNGHTLRRINGKSGDIVWGWTSPDQTSLVVYSKVVTTSDAIYLIGLAKSFASYTVHVSAISPDNGELLSDADVPSSIINGPQGLIVVSHEGTRGKSVRLAWLEQARIHSVALTPQLKDKPTIKKGSAYLQVHDIGLQEKGLFVATKEDGSGRVIRFSEDGALKVFWEFADSSPKYTESTYAGGLDKDGWPYIARVYWSHVFRQASAHVLAPHLAEGKGLVTGFTFPFETQKHGIIANVAVDAANPEEFRVLSRLVLTTTTGAVQLWQQDQHQWTREESLADIRVAEMVELPEPQLVASQVGIEETESFGARLRRQLADAQDFPQYAINFAKRFATGSYASASSSIAPASNDTSPLSRDTFGFRKIIVAATSHGKVFGIDSANGEIIWSRVFGLGWAAEVGGRIFPLKIFTTRTVSDGDTPQVVIVGQRKADNSLVDTVAFHIDALTGEDVSGTSIGQDILQGQDVIAGALVEAYLFQDGPTKYVVLLDEYLQVHLFPDTPENADSFHKVAPSIHLPLRTGTAGSHRLGGHKVSPEKEFTGRHIAYPIWTASLPPNEDVRSIVTRPHEPVASLGKVLGNRTTLYKYLNPGVVVVLTSTSTPSGPATSCGVYVIDGTKGTILYHANLPAAGGVCDVKAAFTENWLVYHYYDDGSANADQAKSYRMVSLEFYEGSGVDDKTSSSDLSAYSNDTTRISVYEQSYVFPRGISTITTTSTKFGITVKDILVAGNNHQVQSFPRRFLDPRRPNRKPTAEEQEEWLIQYDPLLPDDPKRVLSHRYQVARIRKIITSPALLESTSLVFGYGVDLFFTRVAPSKTFDVLNENFNKAQLVLTVAGLALAIVITKPMVRRKRLRERWYAS
ncbi:unnamed protein product [Somion occarium]|uniref:ER membrane protein complex subunit 1 n=1 Tax=Somion occarium TaxID=3059160 RepID=A0ABP1CUY4_9APHY